MSKTDLATAAIVVVGGYFLIKKVSELGGNLFGRPSAAAAVADSPTVRTGTAVVPAKQMSGLDQPGQQNINLRVVNPLGDLTTWKTDYTQLSDREARMIEKDQYVITPEGGLRSKAKDAVYKGVAAATIHNPLSPISGIYSIWQKIKN